MAQAYSAGALVDGALSFSSIDVDETEEEVKGSAGQLQGYHFANLSSATLYVKLYDGTAADVRVGTTVPIQVYALQARTSANRPLRLAFLRGLCIAAVTGVRDDSTTGPGDNECVVALEVV